MCLTTQQHVTFVSENIDSVEVGELKTEIAQEIAFASSMATSTRFSVTVKYQ